MRKTDFEFLIELLHQNAGWSFSEREYFAIDKKISNFIREKNYPSVEDLIADLKSGHKALVSQVIETLAFSDTRFFRDYAVFEQFENYVLPLVKEANRSQKKLRILSLGCSTGQEVYSIAICVSRLIGLSDWQVNIIGTDLSSTAIAKAQRGYYDQFEIQTGLNAGTMVENFTLDGDSWRVNDEIKKMVEFRRYNLLDDLTFNEKFDIIFCRNVLRFFTPDIQYKLSEKIHDMQISGGILYLGKGENIKGMNDFYGAISGVSCAYQSKLMKEAAVRLMPDEALIIPGDAASESGKDDDMPRFIRPASLTPKRPLISEVLRK